MSRKSPRVLVVEDEESYVEALRIGLDREGFDVTIARDGAEALDRFASVDPDLVLLDLMLPKVSGLDVCRELRRHSSVPIIMVTAKDTELDTVVGLEIGADDYVTKPYRIRELVARMRAALRRGDTSPDQGPRQDGEDDGILEVADVRLDLDRYQVTVRGDRVELPLKEFDVLALLLRRAGRVVSRQQLIEQVWGYDYVGDTKTLDVHIKRLRAKVETDPSTPLRIVTVRGVGYRFEVPQT